MISLRHYLTHHACVGNITAKSKRLQFAFSAVRFELCSNKICMLITGKLSNHSALFISIEAVINKLIADAIIFEGYDELVDDCVSQAKLIWKVFVKQLKKIMIIHSFRSRGQTKQKLRLKIFNDFHAFG